MGQKGFLNPDRLNQKAKLEEAQRAADGRMETADEDILDYDELGEDDVPF